MTNILSGNTVSSKAKAGTVIGNFSHAGASGGQFVLDAGQLDAGPAADLAGKDLGPGSLAQIRAQHVAGDPPLAVAVDDAANRCAIRAVGSPASISSFPDG